jgi:hypothetical protein
MVAEKNKNIPPKEVPRKMAKMVPKEGAEIKHQSVSRYIGGTCNNFNVHASWEARWPSLS